MLNRRRVPFWKDTLRIRIIALSFLVVLVGAGSQILVNSLTASAKMLSVDVTTYHADGRMADGRFAYIGACATSNGQFPYGTIVALYRTDGTFVAQCEVEDTLARLPVGHIALTIPEGSNQLNRWQEQQLSVQILQWGTNKLTATNLKSVSQASQHLSIARSPFEKIQLRYHMQSTTCLSSSPQAHGC